MASRVSKYLAENYWDGVPRTESLHSNNPAPTVLVSHTTQFYRLYCIACQTMHTVEYRITVCYNGHGEFVDVKRYPVGGSIPAIKALKALGCNWFDAICFPRRPNWINHPPLAYRSGPPRYVLTSLGYTADMLSQRCRDLGIRASYSMHSVLIHFTMASLERPVLGTADVHHLRVRKALRRNNNYEGMIVIPSREHELDEYVAAVVITKIGSFLGWSFSSSTNGNTVLYKDKRVVLLSCEDHLAAFNERKVFKRALDE